MGYTKPHHRYRDQSNDAIEELLSNYLVDSWSYSKIMSFSRNEKEFEMRYLYCIHGKMSSTTVAGTAYHSALQLYFQELMNGNMLDVADLESEAFRQIEDLPAYRWKLQKTTPSIEECVISATKTATALIENFIAWDSIYLSEIKEVKQVELSLSEWIRVNGVDIPMPCNCKIDLVIESVDGKTVIIDHKSKRTFSDEQELKFSGGRQAITYVLCYETATGKKVDEVWFIENKYSKNKDKSPQLVPFKIIIDDDTRKLYEALLYEPLKRMIEAVSDPDYVYLINDTDTLTDRAEMYQFWSQTMLAEVDSFNVPDSKKEKVKERLRKIRNSSLGTINPKIIRNFEKYASEFIQYDLSNKDMTREEKIEHVLRTFGIIVKVQYKLSGFSSDTYLLDVSAGIALTTILKHKLDIANALDVSSVRVMKDLLVHEGKSYLAIESSKRREQTLYFDPSLQDGMNIPLGFDNFQRKVTWNLNNPSTPHMLVCGATGSGKSVFLRSTIEYGLLAGIDRVVIFDPKFEFTEYDRVPNVSVYSDIEEIELQMMILVDEMNDYVRRGISRKTLVVFDEFADAVASSRKGNELKNYKEVIVGISKNGIPKTKRECTGADKSLEENLKILLQKGRSSGFRIIAATQRASTKVITGDAKVNFPVQVCFRVPKEIDSKVVIDESGAEALIGQGDGLIKSPDYLEATRFQAFYKEEVLI